MFAGWPATVIGRKVIREFSGGILSPKTLANEDSKGTGPAGRFLLCGQTCYTKDAMGAWLKSRAAAGWKTRKRA